MLIARILEQEFRISMFLLGEKLTFIFEDSRDILDEVELDFFGLKFGGMNYFLVVPALTESL